MKLFCVVMALACGSATLAGNGVPYPKENVAEFVVERLDVTTLPSTIRPKPEKRKKTFGDYGFTTLRPGEKGGLVEAMPGGLRIHIRILEQKTSGIYVCVEREDKDASNERVQDVVLLRWKEANGLLKGTRTFKEFEGCPVVGTDPDSGSDSYGG